MAPLRLTVLLLASALVAAFSPAGRPLARAAPSTARSFAVDMKHNDYFQRVARAETGRLRLCIFRSNNHIYAQVIDDSKSHIVASASTMEKDVREGATGNCAAATEVGKRVAKRALEKGVDKVFFDRNGRPYHGRVAALADGAREAGLSF